MPGSFPLGGKIGSRRTRCKRRVFIQLETVVKKIIAPLVLIAASVTAHAQTPSVGKALETSMLAGSSFGSSSCTELTDLFNGNVERAYGKVKKDQLTMALGGWFEGYMEAFRLSTAYNRPELLRNLTGLDLKKMQGELKNYCTVHPDWTLLLAAGRVSMQIAQDATDRYK
jgi:hypothetical protein